MITKERELALKLQDQFLMDWDGAGFEPRLEYVLEGIYSDTYYLIVSEGACMHLFYDVDAKYCCHNGTVDYDDPDSDELIYEDIFDNYGYDTISPYGLEVAKEIGNRIYYRTNMESNLQAYSDGRCYNLYIAFIRAIEHSGIMAYPDITSERELELWIKAASTSDYLAKILADEGSDEEGRVYTPSWSYKLISKEMAENLGQNYESLCDMLRCDLDYQNMFA